MTADTKPAGALELKGCPFCGPGQSMVDPWFDDVSKRWAVGCGRCGASSGRSIHAEGSKEAAIKAWNTRALPAEAGVGDDALAGLVHRFSNALLAKLRLAQANGRSGWDKDDWERACQQGLLHHLEKGDPRDVAAYCAFLWHHGWPTTSPPPIRESSETTSSDRGNVKYDDPCSCSPRYNLNCAYFKGGYCKPPSEAIRESVREEIARIICCNGKCILSDTAGGCILNDPAHDGDLKKADAILALSPPAERLGTRDEIALDLYYSDPENEGFEPDVKSADYQEKYLRFANVFMSRFTIARKDGGR